MPQTILFSELTSHSSMSFLGPFGMGLSSVGNKLLDFFHLYLDSLVSYLGQNFANKCLDSNSTLLSDFLLLQ